MRACSAGVFLVAAAVAGGAEPTPKPADSIAAAGRELSEIRTVAAPDAGTGVPILELKDLGPVAGSVPAPTPSPLPSDRQADPSRKRSGDSWLLDAMDGKVGGGRSLRMGDDLLKTDSELALEGERTQTAPAKGAGAAGEPREKEAPKEPPQGAFNPLDSFMGSWISVRDHDLLLPHAKGEGFAEAQIDGVRNDAPIEAGASAAAQTPEFTLPVIDSSGWLEARTNPYLASIDPSGGAVSRDPPALQMPAENPFSLPEPFRGGDGVAVDPRPVDASRPFLPDFAQPGDDDKYFRQLKKF